MVTTSSSGIQAAMVMVNPDTQKFCSGDCTGQMTLSSERKVLAHELGHFLGLGHFFTDTQNLMYPTSLPGGSLSDVTIDEATFTKLISGNN
jgi:predicted Zn-dependent protease